ncbi:hypothetical protein CYY_000634 [Polysphondylium violaceum]|uniref:type I protein arginine methyltransferase n=1 Tax=Polysphondylium violaceum TaxID=133409 RepID=A0A8J4Q176_9MYCE|nr:hypothetical protein CYY_000634 [Polysphondylium violaceum]
MNNIVDDKYFESYFDLNVHELMLKDKPRTLAYKDAIEKNASDFKDKVILDVGSGTGILSMFAAKAGAKKVYAVEGSLMAIYCKQLVEANNLDSIITVIHKRLEDIEQEIPEKVDIIISEWMGFYLFHESMLDSVIYARDKYLKPNGIMFPSRADLFMTPVNLDSFYKKKINFWNDVYGFDFSLLSETAFDIINTAPLTDTLEPSQKILKENNIRQFNFNTITIEELADIVIDDIEFNYNIENPRAIHGFGIWFICYFDGTTTTVELSTSPDDPETHWKQTTILMPQGGIQLQGGEVMKCRLQMTQDIENKRRYELSLDFPDSDDEQDDDQDHEDEDTLETTNSHEYDSTCECLQCSIITQLSSQSSPQ